MKSSEWRSVESGSELPFIIEERDKIRHKVPAAVSAASVLTGVHSVALNAAIVISNREMVMHCELWLCCTICADTEHRHQIFVLVSCAFSYCVVNCDSSAYIVLLGLIIYL